jgi:hypothetical protein
MAKRLTSRQQLGLEALLSGALVKEAAETARVREDTVSKWLALPHFAEALAEGRRERLAGVHRRIGDLTPEAVEVLGAIMHDGKARNMDRIRAAIALLDRGGVVKGVRVEVSGGVAVSGATPDAVMGALGTLEKALRVLEG